MNKLNQQLTNTYVEAQTKYGSCAVQKAMRICGTLAMMLICSAMFASAGVEAIQEGVQKGAGQLYNIATVIVLPLAVISFAYSGIKAFFGGEKGLEQAKKTMISSIIILGQIPKAREAAGCAIMFAAIILSQIADPLREKLRNRKGDNKC